MPRKKKKPEVVVLPSEEELEFRSAPGFENTTNNVMQLVVGREIADRLTSPGGPNWDVLRKVVD